ncbi:chemotaxis-specific protein-glutamate methyltransferase CheB [Xanthobacter sp. KR7-65]|uniref:chemotaxis-specific protein-glutamate methyltransferase CheB n=1 Tax=Xanthobacter sp. KR7-65 TaxID=3156612 RepID=UPI0032B313CC
MTARIRVLLAEDSPSQRETLAFAITSGSELELAGVASNGAEAVEKVEQLKPDIVLMDCHMPVLDGIAATRAIMWRCPVPVVMASASFGPSDVHPGLEALREGALAIVPKPPDPAHPDFDRVAAELRLSLRLMSEVRVVRRTPPRQNRATVARRAAGRVRVVAIGASTGGPPVILEILRGLDPRIEAPILVVQHIAPGFTAGFASWLARSCGLPVEVAAANAPAQAGHVYVAPEGSHLGIDRRGRIVLDDGPAENGFKPSVSHLFRSAADSFGSAALAVLLTGMGEDGAEGLAHISRCGGISVAQDKDTSVVFGMPAAALRLGAVQRMLAPPDIAPFILGQLARKSLPS